MILTEEEILQSWYSTTELMPSDGMVQQRKFVRAIEVAILNKLQDKLKNAERYEYMKQFFEVQFSMEYFGNIGSTPWLAGEEIDEVIDSAMENSNVQN